MLYLLVAFLLAFLSLKISLNQGRNRILWFFICLTFPFMFLILLQLGSKETPNKSINWKSVGIRVALSILVFISVSLLKIDIWDNPLRNAEAKMIGSLLNEINIINVVKGNTIRTANFYAYISENVLNTVFAIFAYSIIFGMFVFKKQPLTTIIIGFIGLLTGFVTKFLKDFLFYLALYIYSPQMTESAYVPFTLWGLQVAFLLLFLITVHIIKRQD